MWCQVGVQASGKPPELARSNGNALIVLIVPFATVSSLNGALAKGILMVQPAYIGGFRAIGGLLCVLEDIGSINGTGGAQGEPLSEISSS